MLRDILFINFSNRNKKTLLIHNINPMNFIIFLVKKTTIFRDLDNHVLVILSNHLGHNYIDVRHYNLILTKTR